MSRRLVQCVLGALFVTAPALAEEADTPGSEAPTVHSPRLSVEAVGGALLLRGAHVPIQTVAAMGARVGWDAGPVLPAGLLHHTLLLDVRWALAGWREGTELVAGDTRVQHLTIAPAFVFLIDRAGEYGVYAQVGGGVAHVRSAVSVDGAETAVGNFVPTLQYGAGLRGVARMFGDASPRLSWRLEVARFRRGGQDDTFLGASVGAAF
ncbi:MAG: hypothetical protein L0Y66_25130 [Myxococcaceae bacterium]|nr:hypothetical protein [Myxococcaceae bacterium]MCI0669439.1 hypothetical protein [Myxococcaceae bacterium]